MMARQVVGFLYRCPPVWSAGGRYLAQATGGGLWQWDLGNDVVDPMLDLSPALMRYLPSGHLLFASANLDSEHSLHLLDPESGVVEEEIAHSRSFDWDVSGDGERLYVTRLALDEPQGPAVRSELWETTLATGDRRLILTDGAGPLSPRVAPDGSGVLFLSHQGAHPVLKLWDRASGRTRTLHDAGEHLTGPLSWCGRRHVLYYISGMNDIKDITYTLWRFALDSGQAEPVCDTPIYNPRPPVPSPDGRRLAVTVGARREFADPGRILLFDFETGAREVILDAWCPAYDPRHSRLAYLAPWPSNQRGERLFMRNLANGEERCLSLPKTVE